MVVSLDDFRAALDEAERAADRTDDPDALRLILRSVLTQARAATRIVSGGFLRAAPSRPVLPPKQRPDAITP